MGKSQNNQKKGEKCLKAAMEQFINDSLQTLSAFLLIILTFFHNLCLEYRLYKVWSTCLHFRYFRSKTFAFLFFFLNFTMPDGNGRLLEKTR